MKPKTCSSCRYHNKCPKEQQLQEAIGVGERDAELKCEDYEK